MTNAIRRGVPPYRIDSLKPRAHEYCVTVFALNEDGRLLRQLAEMEPLTKNVDLIVADGGSTDGSTQLASLALVGATALLTNEGRKGLGAQMRMAFDYAIAEGYSGVIAVDGNGKDDTSAVPRFVEALKGGADHVQGSRFVPGGRAINTPLLRLLALRILHAPAIRLASGFPYTDTTNGFRAYSRMFLTDSRLQVFRDCFLGYELHYYLAIRAAKLGFRAMEIPVTRRYPPGPPTSKIRGFRGNARVLTALLRACLGMFDPPVDATR
jgi:dolichol-phosphate mannosyltransferase